MMLKWLSLGCVPSDGTNIFVAGNVLNQHPTTAHTLIRSY